MLLNINLKFYFSIFANGRSKYLILINKSGKPGHKLKISLTIITQNSKFTKSNDSWQNLIY